MNSQSDLKVKLSQMVQNQNFGHAILFNGKMGYGTLALAHWLAQQLLCPNENNACLKKTSELQHADYHFCFPVALTETIKKKTSAAFLPEWRTFFKENPYRGLLDWMQYLGVEKKQGSINVDQAHEIIQTLSLRSYEGGYRVMLIWLPETMHLAVVNKLLKSIEEPPPKTVFLLVSEQAETLLPTLLSRCQLIQVSKLTNDEVKTILLRKTDLTEEAAAQVALIADGDISKAMDAISTNRSDYNDLFVHWVRNAFKAKKDVTALHALKQWSEQIAPWSRERQKHFLQFCSEVFRQALLQNYGAPDLVKLNISVEGFKWDGFSQFIHGANIEDILHELDQASYHIERNGNAKIILLDMGIQLTRFIHAKAN